jgi:dihydrofolate reductase
MAKKISLIAALAENNVIGGKNQMLWHISNDLKHFKQVTSGHPVIMGKNTYLSLPVKPLPKRTNIVMTRKGFDGCGKCVIVSSMEEALEHMSNQDENFVIGGGEVYRLFLPLAQKLYLTRVHQPYEGDTHFPEIAEDEWQLVENEEITNDPQNDFTYSFQLYVRK